MMSVPGDMNHAVLYLDAWRGPVYSMRHENWQLQIA